MECHFGGTIRTNLPTGSISQFMLGRELSSTLYGSRKKSQLIGQHFDWISTSVKGK